MLKKFALWFICFGLSFLVSDVFGWTEQGKAFLWINLGGNIVIILVAIAGIIMAGVIKKEFLAMASGISFLTILATIGTVAIILFATWGATKLFGVDFYVAYQIMTFGQCLVTNSNKKNDDD